MSESDRKQKLLLKQWQDCGKWLHRIGFIREDHKLNGPNCTIQDFAMFFRDGVTLCKLLHHIDRTSIDMTTINQRPHNAQILCKKNIKKFLSCCTKHFKLRDTELFTPEQLFEFTDFGKLLECLSKLSLCPKVKELSVEGFSLPPTAMTHEDEEDFYRSLQDFANANHELIYGTRHQPQPEHYYSSLVPLEQRHYTQVASAFYEDENYYCDMDIELGSRYLLDPCLDTYSDFVFGHTPEYYSHVQNQMGGLSGKAPRDKRDCCVHELLETERAYVKALGDIIRIFLEPLKEILTPDQIDIIFSRLRGLYDLHRSLLQALNEGWSHSGRNSSVQVNALAEVFLRYQEQFLIYGEYCAHFQTSQTLLDEIMVRPQIRDKIRDGEARMSTEKHQLRDLLFVPVQRILKYPLLLRELVKNTNKEQPELVTLQAAVDCMVDVAEYVNEFKRDKETLKILEDVQASITDLPSELGDLTKLGRMRLDGEIRIECHPEKNKLRSVFLFDRALIMCKQSRRLSVMLTMSPGSRWSIGESLFSIEMPEMLRGDEKYQYKDYVFLNGCKIDPMDGSCSMLDMSASGMNSAVLNSSGSGRRGSGNSFLLVVAGNRKAYTIIAKNEMERDKWLNAVSLAIDAVCPSENLESAHNFVLTTFEQPFIRCAQCHKLLKGSINQGYICSLCKSASHRECLGPLCLQSTCQPDSAANNNSHHLHTLLTPNSMSSGPVPLVPSISQPFSQLEYNRWEEFWALPMRNLPWWSDSLTREQAEDALQVMPQGTFVMRWSDKHQQPVVSLKVSLEVKHMRVWQDGGPDIGGPVQYYFCKAQMFPSLVDLIKHYHVYPLSEAFQELEERLVRPLYDSAMSLFEFRGSTAAASPTASNKMYLHLDPQQRLVVLGHQGQDRGWWKGRSGNKVGFFPCKFVQLDETPIISL